MPRWPHAPRHDFTARGVYMVTATTLNRVPYFDAPDLRSRLQDELLGCADRFGWGLQSWGVMPDHYHFMARSPEEPQTLPMMIRRLHSVTAIAVNKSAGVSNRKIWRQYWDTRIRDERDYFARMAYVYHNPVKHGLTLDPLDYPWCSARWLREHTHREFFQALCAYKPEKLRVPEPGSA